MLIKNKCPICGKSIVVSIDYIDVSTKKKKAYIADRPEIVSTCEHFPDEELVKILKGCNYLSDKTDQR